MKRIISLALAAALLTAVLSACGDSNAQTSTNPPDGPAESASVQPTDTPTQEPSEQPDGEPSKDVPADPDRVNLAAFAQTVQENHEFPMLDRIDFADEEFGAVMLENAYPGLKDMDLEQAEIYLAIISFSGGELALVQAKDFGDAVRVKDIFEARIAAKTTEGPNNYPEEVELWQHNSVVAYNGNYVMLVNHEDSAAIVNEFNELFK